MNDELETLEAAQLDQVTGGFLDKIGEFANMIGPMLEKAGVKGAAAGAQKYGGMAQDFLGKIMQSFSSPGGGASAGAGESGGGAGGGGGAGM